MTAAPQKNIRNFAIIAHIDHGKSTLADRLIQMTGGLTAREMKEQVLDSMDIERERGITIKAQTVRLNYRAKDGEDYVLNLIDTPGHVDFAYEVNRSLAACEGSLLVVDASQGVEAQTLANVYQAIDNNHEIVPVLNKIDLPAAEPDRVKQQIEDVIGLDASDAVLISAKTGLGVEDVLEAIVTPPAAAQGRPRGAAQGAARRQLVRRLSRRRRAGPHRRRRAQEGRAHPHDADRRGDDVDRVGVFTPKLIAGELGPGEIGFLTGSIKEVADTRVGDTITDDRKPVDRDAARLPPGAAGRLLRPLPGRRRRVRGPPRRHGQAPPQRRELLLRDGDLRRARLRLPLRLSRPPPPRDHPGAAAARVRPRPDRHRALGHLPDAADRRLGDRAAQSGRHARPGQDRRRSASRGSGRPSSPPTSISARSSSSARTGAARQKRPVLCRQPRHGPIRPAAQRGGLRLLRPAEVGLEGLRLLRLPHHRLPRGRPRQDVDPGQRRAGRCAVDAGPSHPGREPRPRHGARSSRS